MVSELEKRIPLWRETNPICPDNKINRWGVSCGNNRAGMRTKSIEASPKLQPKSRDQQRGRLPSHSQHVTTSKTRPTSPNNELPASVCQMAVAPLHTSRDYYHLSCRERGAAQPSQQSWISTSWKTKKDETGWRSLRRASSPQIYAASSRFSLRCAAGWLVLKLANSL